MSQKKKMKKIKLFFKQIIRIIVRFAIKLYFVVIYRVKVIGQENIPKNKKEPLIYCGNHRTYKDPPLIVVTAKRHVRFLAKEELRKNKFFAFLGVVFDGIYVKRDSKDLSAIKTTLKALKNGESIALFPEGTRSRTGSMIEAKKGVILVARMSKANIIPISLSGTEKLLPINKEGDMSQEKWNNAVVNVNIGEPVIIPKKDKEESKHDYDERCLNYLMKAIAKGLPEKYRGVYK